MASSRESNQADRLSGALSGVEALYTGSLAEYGIDPKAVGWRDADSQALRFEKLAYVLDLDSPTGGISINDWGCGYGAMFDFLDHRPNIELRAYHGYDVSAEMLSAARAHVDDPRAEFINSSEISRPADYTFVSGTFNVRADASERQWAEYVKGTILEIAERSQRGFAFNLLTSYVDWKKDDLFYADPAEFFRFCRRRISRFVTLLHDYPLYEWTIAVLHEDVAD